jgi:hypothetical protein
MSDKPVSATVSALCQVLARSVEITQQLDLKQGSWWEYTGFDKYAKALQAEYQTLVDLRTEIREMLEALPNDLRGDAAIRLGELVETFGEVEAQMLALERKHVTNTTEARNEHKALVTAQIDIARPLKDQISDAIEAASDETDAINTDDALKAELKADRILVQGLKDAMEALLLLDVSGAALTSPNKLQAHLRQCDYRLSVQIKPLTPKQRDGLSGFDALELEYRKAATAETERKDKQKILDDWAAALNAAKIDIDNWKNNAEIAEAQTSCFRSSPSPRTPAPWTRRSRIFPSSILPHRNRTG